MRLTLALESLIPWIKSNLDEAEKVSSGHYGDAMQNEEDHLTAVLANGRSIHAYAMQCSKGDRGGNRIQHVHCITWRWTRNCLYTDTPNVYSAQGKQRRHKVIKNHNNILM